jgi:hypothetical protein
MAELRFPTPQGELSGELATPAGTAGPDRPDQETTSSMRRFGPNLFGEPLLPGSTTRLGFGIVVDQPLPHIPLVPGSLLVVAPDALLHASVPQPAGRVLYDLLTGHPARPSGALVFLVDLTEELWAWDGSTWAMLGVDPAGVCEAIAHRHLHGEVNALRFDDLRSVELQALRQLPMATARAALRRRLQARIDAAHLDWLGAASSSAPMTVFL